MLIYICVIFSEQKDILAASVQSRNKVILFKKHGLVNVSMEFLVSKEFATVISTILGRPICAGCQAIMKVFTFKAQ